MESSRPRKLSQHGIIPTFLLLFLLLLIVLPLFTDAAHESNHDPIHPTDWKLTQRLREGVEGHSYYQFSSSIHSFQDRYVVIGSTSANLGKGEVRILYDYGNGLKDVARLTDPDGVIHDDFGAYVLFFRRFGAIHLAISATGKGGDGSVFVFKEGTHKGDWPLQQVLVPPEDLFIYLYGRIVLYDGTQLLISSVRRYVSGKRFVVSAVNWKGTRFFQESTGVEPMAGDPILVYESAEDRNNATFLEYSYALEDGDYTLDYGVSIALSGDTMVVGGSSREELKYGHGTDGDLVVTDTYFLDGTAEFNFNSILIKNGGTLTVDRFETLRGSGGILTLRIKGDLIIEEGGAINLTANGYRGGPTAFTGTQVGERGKFLGGGGAATSTLTGVFACDYDGTTSVGKFTLNEFEGGTKRSNSTLPFAEASGGGGGHGTRGESGTAVQCGSSGTGGNTYGDEFVTFPFRGSGGGSGHPWKIGSGGQGGAGGGVISIAAKRVTNYGHMVADGGHGEDGGYYSGGGGGGSGGSIILVGDKLANYGFITAKGGRGGERAIGSGSGGDQARGGNGGAGRVRFDFLVTQSHGIVVPNPMNGTTFLGSVAVYKRSVTTGKWTFRTFMPRLRGMMFIGHSVALDGHLLAVASDEGTPIEPAQEVWLMDVRQIQNSSSLIPNYRVIRPPDRMQDVKFGHQIAIHNNSVMAIASPGSDEYRGVVYVHRSRDLLRESTFRRIVTMNPVAGDGFGSTLHLAVPQLFVQLPSSHDDSPPANTRRSAGCVHLYKLSRNISVSDSFVSCEFTAVTANVTMNCTVTTVGSDGHLTGDLNELQYFQPSVDFKSIGLYTFQTKQTLTGSREIAMFYRGRKLKSFATTVTGQVDPMHSNFSCAPMVVEAGKPVTCTVSTYHGTGEEIAAREFDVIVYNLGDAQLHADGFLVETELGNIQTPPSISLQTDALPTDFPSVYPSMSFVRQGQYQFTFTPWRSGPMAAFAMYKRVPLRFPNPVIVDARDPPVSTAQSSVVCPGIAAPNRTVSCKILLKGSDQTPAGAEALMVNFSSSRNVQATMNGGANSFSHVAVAAGEGQYALLIKPDIEGTLQVTVQYKGVNLPVAPSAGVDVREMYSMTCNKMPLLMSSFTMFSQHLMGRGDPGRYGETLSTRAFYSDGVGFCDDPKV